MRDFGYSSEEYAAIRAENERLRVALKREKFAHGDFPTAARQAAHARIDAALRSVENSGTDAKTPANPA